MNGKSLKDVYRHIEITNREMGKVKEDIASIKTNCTWIIEEQKKTNERIETTNKRLWWILGTLIVSIVGIAISMFTGI